MDSIKGSTLERLAVELDEWPQTEGQHGSCYFIASSKYYGPYHPDIVVTTEGFTSRNWRDAKALLDAKPEAPEWDGEGLPPVGAECEIAELRYAGDGDEYTIWRFAKVIGYDGPAAVVAIDGGGYVGSSDQEEFRPIRSEEDKAIDEMMATAGISYVKPEHTEMICRALYRAGYRKQ